MGSLETRTGLPQRIGAKRENRSSLSTQGFPAFVSSVSVSTETSRERGGEDSFIASVAKLVGTIFVRRSQMHVRDHSLQKSGASV